MNIQSSSFAVLALPALLAGCISTGQSSSIGIPTWTSNAPVSERVYLTAAATGDLTLDGKCLRLKGKLAPVTVIWPTGTYLRANKVVVRADGSQIAKVGNPVSLSGAIAQNTNDLSIAWAGAQECPGPYFLANP